MQNSLNQDINIKPSINYFGTVNTKGVQKTFGILQEDRNKHIYVLGKTGMGKTTLLQNMILQDIYNGFGCCFIDPHGDSSEYIMDRIPPHRQNDVIYFNPADTDFPIGLNMLEPQQGEERFLVASGLVAVFHKLWKGMWSARMEYILNNTLLALLETPDNTLLNVIQMLTDIEYRRKIVSKIQDPLVKNFWTKEFASFNERYKQEAVSPILNKIGQFLSNSLIRNIVGQKHSTLDFRSILDEQKILIVNLSKGKLGEDNSNMLGSLIVTKLQLAAISRVDTPINQRENFFLYVDEFQNFITESFATILSEARKYKLCLTIAHQYIGQLSESGNDAIKNAIFGNIGTIISFRIGSDDAETLVKEFAPIFSTEKLLSLDRFQIALNLSINGNRSKAFLAQTLAPIFDKLNGRFTANMLTSRQKFGIEKRLIDLQIDSVMGVKKSQPHTNSAQISSALSSQNHDKLSKLRRPKPGFFKNPSSTLNTKLPLSPQTNLNIPSNQKISGSLQALQKARSQIQTSNHQNFNPQNIDINDEQLFNLPD